MSDSYITKNALAESLKKLVSEIPFNQITINDICSNCKLSRKSFYYHFEDKYNLVNWIFDTAFSDIINNATQNKNSNILIELYNYFYINRSFYQKIFSFKGQNSLSEHLKKTIYPLILNSFTNIPDENLCTMKANFFTKSFVNTIEFWLTDKECLSPDEFINLSKSYIQYISEYINNSII